MENREKRDLPEVVADILIEQHAMRGEIMGLREDFSELREEFSGLREEFSGLREEFSGLRTEMHEQIGGLRQEMNQNHLQMIAAYDRQTNAILDAMNRGREEYRHTNQRVDGLENRVERLEGPSDAPAAA